MGNYWNRFLFALLVCVQPLVSQGFYIPCYCGSGDHIFCLEGPCKDFRKEMNEEMKKSEYVQAAKQTLEQLRSVLQIYKDTKEIVSVVGTYRDLITNFSIESLLNTWQITDWSELGDLASKYGGSLYSKFDEATSSSGSSTDSKGSSKAYDSSTAFSRYMRGLAKDIGSAREEYVPTLEDGMNQVRSLQYVNDDYIMQALMQQEQSNAQKKAVAAAASNKAPKVAPDMGIDTTENTIVQQMNAKAVSTAMDASVWSDMGNAYNLMTRQQINAQKAFIESEKKDLETTYLKAFE